MQLSFIHFFYFLYTFCSYISFSGVDKKNQIPCMHPLIPSQNLLVSLLADTRISLTIISFGKSITIMINIRRIIVSDLSRTWNKEKSSQSPRGIEPQTFIFYSNAFLLRHRDSTVNWDSYVTSLPLIIKLSLFFLFFIFLTRFLFLYGNGIFTMLVSDEGLVTPPPSPAMNNECSLISTPQTARISVHWE